MKDNKLGIMPISKLIWNMSLPIIVSMLVQALYNIVDSVFVSQVSEQALTAVTLAFPAQNLMIGLATGTAVGVNALLGRALGAGDGKRADQVAINGIFLAVVGFVLSAVLALCFGGTFFRTQTDIDYIVDNGITYLRICCCASLGMFCQIMFERLLQGTGRSILSMYTQGLGAIVNIVLDPIFIFVFKMGVAGAAVATVIGQFCGCGLALYMNLRKNHDLHLRFRGFRPDWKIVGNIYAIGLPSVVMVAIGSVMTFCMNKILITYHSAKETAATAFGIYFKLNSFVFMPVFGLNNGVVPIVAYNYGAQNRRRMMETIKRSAIYASCIMVLGMAIFWAIPGTLVSIFNATETMKQVAVPALRIISLSFCTAGACIALGSSFQALGKSVYSMITSIIRQLVFLVPIAYVLARYGQSIGNDDLVWWCYPIAEIARGLKAVNEKTLLHTDAVQGFLKVPFSAKTLGADFITISGHKVGGPKGIGALYIGPRVREPRPLLPGGGQEMGLRSGTEPTAQIAGFAKAVELRQDSLADKLRHMADIKAYAIEQLTAIPDLRLIGDGKAPHVLPVALEGWPSQNIVTDLGSQGICISAGSACHQGKASQVVAALKLPKRVAAGVIRLSFGPETTFEEIDACVEALHRHHDTRMPML